MTTKEIQTKAADSYIPDHRLEFVSVQKRIRVFFGGEIIGDSKNAMLLRERGHLPVYYFPKKDVNMDLLAPSDHTKQDRTKGQATYWSVDANGETAKNAAWTYSNPPSNTPGLKGHIAFLWGKMDAWFEEDEEVFVHPRDPYKRIDVLHSSRKVHVEIDGVTIAETQRPVLLFETGLPVRYYIPKIDVRMDLLVPSEKVTRCPYKGEASHYSVKIGEELFKDIVWTYPYPFPEVSKIQNLLCFYHEKLDGFSVDGETVEKIETPWS